MQFVSIITYSNLIHYQMQLKEKKKRTTCTCRRVCLQEQRELDLLSIASKEMVLKILNTVCFLIFVQLESYTIVVDYIIIIIIIMSI